LSLSGSVPQLEGPRTRYEPTPPEPGVATSLPGDVEPHPPSNRERHDHGLKVGGRITQSIKLKTLISKPQRGPSMRS